MTNTQTTMTHKANHHFGMLVLVATLAVVASLLLALAQKPAYATSTFTVTNTNDSGAGSLRQAILDANATTDADLIEFGIPGTGVQTIKPTTPLPPITRPVTIDGYTQQGSSLNTKTVGDDAVLKVQLDGTNVPNDNGLEIDTSDSSVIRGLVINRFGDGIFVHGDSVANRIEGNFIGTDPSGTLRQANHFDGVVIFDGPSETVLGGSTPDKRNIISGNGDFGGSGAFVKNSNVNRIEGNYVGTDKSGTKDLGNTDGGIFVDGASGMTVGGSTAASRNVISGNDDSGLGIAASQGTRVLGNRIGTTAGGTAALGNDLRGVQIFAGSSDNLLGDGTLAGSNTIAFNGFDGVQVDGSSTGNEISRNSIFSNGGLGIDLLGPGEDLSTNVPTPNDAGDTDSLANNLQNKPVLSSAKTLSGKTTIKGTLGSAAGKSFTIEFFSNPSGDEGKKFVGQKSVTTDASGNASFTFSPATAVSVGQAVTATATSDSTHDTSEFSAPRRVR